MLLPRLRCPPSVKLGAQAGKEGESLQREPEKPARASPGFTLLTRFKTGQVLFGSKAEMAKLPEDYFQPSLEQVQAPAACLLCHHPCALLTHRQGKVSPAFVSL